MICVPSTIPLSAWTVAMGCRVLLPGSDRFNLGWNRDLEFRIREGSTQNNFESCISKMYGLIFPVWRDL